MDEQLSDLQLAFMRVIWAKQPASVAQVREGLAALGRVLQPTSVATVLKRLEARGWLAHEREGRVFVYRALRSEQQVRRSVVARVRELVFGGDLSAMVAQLLDPQSVPPEELARVRELLAAHSGPDAASDDRATDASMSDRSDEDGDPDTKGPQGEENP